MTTYILTRDGETEPSVQFDEEFEERLLGRLIKRNLKKFGAVAIKEGQISVAI